MDQEGDWARRCAAITGQSVKTWRTERKLSGQRLADRCAELGMPSLTRTVITKLENGRKESVSTAELLILAQALNVPPVELMFPIGYADAVEALPGREMTPWDACRWLVGGARLVSAKESDPDSTVSLWADHDAALKRLMQSREDSNYWLGKLAASEQAGRVGEAAKLREIAADPYDEIMHAQVNALQRLRGQIRQRGMTPPPVDPETAEALGEGKGKPDGAR